MAPEQAWGQTHLIGPVTDLYSLGAILYEMLVGRPPFQGASALETIELVRTQEPVPPTRLQPKVPVDLETICLKCLQKDPAKRYSDAQSPLPRICSDSSRAGRSWHVPSGPSSDSTRWCRRNPKVAGLAAAVAGLLVTVAAVSTYAALSLDRAYGRLVESNKAESAARDAAETNERAAIKARISRPVRARESREARQARPRAEQERTGVAAADQRLDLDEASRYRGHPGTTG